MNVPYLLLLENLGIRILPFQIHVFSTILNRTITKWTYSRKQFYRIWFSLGTVVVILLLLPSIFLLMKNVIIQLSGTTRQKQQASLQPMVPGYNLPYEEFPFYFFTLLVTSLFHELGHAVAAVGEDVHLNGIGFLLLCILPAAYVDLPTDSVQKLAPFKQLKVFCAGVWHNFVMALMAFCIGMCVPVMMSPLYKYNEGIVVVALDENSPAKGLHGLFAGDIIRGVNFCEVKGLSDWRHCLSENVGVQTGFCISEDIVNDNDETSHHPFAHPDGSIECCEARDGGSLCFELRQDETQDNGESPMHPYTCLSARVAVTSSNNKCVTSSECASDNYYCLTPSIRNSTRLLYIVRQQDALKNASPNKSVLFWGPPSHLYSTVSMTNYIPLYSFLPYALPSTLEIICDYIVKFSGGLAIVNLIPCFYLDGYRIFGAIIDLLLAKHLHASARNVLHLAFTLLGTLLLVVSLFVSLSGLMK